MSERDLSQRLDNVATLWTLVRQAHEGSTEAVKSAQDKLLARYEKAIRRFLLGCLKEEATADVVFQQFALKLVRGDLRGADPNRGRFRSFVKTTLYHLVVDQQRQRKAQPVHLPSSGPEPIAASAAPGDERDALDEGWRDQLLSGSWKALAKTEETTGRPVYSVLRFRVDHSSMSSKEMAVELGKQLHKRLSAAGVRQMIHRAREEFADLLVQEVVQTLDQPSWEQVEEELIELRLLEYCRPYLNEIRQKRFP